MPLSTSRSTGNAPFSVLIVRTGAMGDVLHAMPAVTAMREHDPECRIGWAIEPRWRSLLEGIGSHGPVMPLVDRIHEVPTRDWNRRPVSLTTLREILALRKELKAERYDLCVDMQGLFRSSVVGRLASTGRFAGAAQPRETPARWLYKQIILTHARHVIERGCELLGGALGETLTPAKVSLPVDEEAERWCEATLAQLIPNRTQRFAMIAPTAGWGAKCWPAEKFGRLAGILCDAGYAVLINAASEDDPVAATVVQASGDRAQTIFCDLPQLIAVLRRTGAMIAGDTGPLHLAAALGRPVVGVYGPTDPKRTGPYNTATWVVRHPSSVEDHRRHSVTETGLMQVTVDEVSHAALAAMNDATGETRE